MIKRHAVIEAAAPKPLSVAVHLHGRTNAALLVLLPLVVLLATGCARLDTRAEQGVRTRTLHVNAGAEPRDFDPQTTTLPADGVVIRSLMEGLAESDPLDCRPVPAVASGWDVAPDGLTWTFHLRREARWSNGDPVTAHDFVFAYRRVLSPALAAEYRDQFYCLQNAREFSA